MGWSPRILEVSWHWQLRSSRLRSYHHDCDRVDIVGPRYIHYEPHTVAHIQFEYRIRSSAYKFNPQSLSSSATGTRFAT